MLYDPVRRMKELERDLFGRELIKSEREAIVEAADRVLYGEKPPGYETREGAVNGTGYDES